MIGGVMTNEIWKLVDDLVDSRVGDYDGDKYEKDIEDIKSEIEALAAKIENDKSAEFQYIQSGDAKFDHDCDKDGRGGVMKAIRAVLKKYHSQLDTTLNGDGTRINHLDHALADIKKIVLGWVGEDEDMSMGLAGNVISYNRAKAEIRKKISEVEGEL